MIAAGGLDQRPVIEPRPLGPVRAGQPLPRRVRDQGRELVARAAAAAVIIALQATAIT